VTLLALTGCPGKLAIDVAGAALCVRVGAGQRKAGYKMFKWIVLPSETVLRDQNKQHCKQYAPLYFSAHCMTAPRKVFVV